MCLDVPKYVAGRKYQITYQQKSEPSAAKRKFDVSVMSHGRYQREDG